MEVDPEIRLQWIELLKKSLKKNPFFENLNIDAIYVARRMEEFAHRNRQHVTLFQGIPIYKYGEKQIVFDDNEAHIHAAYLQYVENMQRAVFVCLEGNIENVRYEPPENWIENEKIVEGTSHQEWERNYFAKQEIAKSVLASKEATKGLFSCPKCKSYDVDTDQKQTRSADEPMTIFCSCNACGKRFIR